MLREVGRLREASSSPSSSGGAALLWRVKAPFMCRFGLPDRFDFSASPRASAIEYCVLRVACLPFGPLRAPRSATTLRVASESAASASRVPVGCRLKFEYHRLRAVVPRSMPLSPSSMSTRIVHSGSVRVRVQEPCSLSRGFRVVNVDL